MGLNVLGRVVHEASCPLGRNVPGVSCPWDKLSMGETTVGRNVMGRVLNRVVQESVGLLANPCVGGVLLVVTDHIQGLG
jgi:hypothetical protein